MIVVHLSANGKAAIIDPKLIMFAEDCDGNDKDGNPVQFTRLYLKQPLPGDEGTSWIDIREPVAKIAIMISTTIEKAR